MLWQYNVLNTVPEQMFDNLAELAARICEAPITLISLVDEKRQWFKSRIGIDLKETARDVSFCGHAILQQELFIVPNAAKNKRFAQNPMVVSEPKIRFYAGAPPILDRWTAALGHLSVLDQKPHKLHPDQKRALQILAATS